MFVGKAEHTVNKDGRLSIPSKMRDVINKDYDANDLYLILMPGDVLCLYPGEEFAELTARLDNPDGTSFDMIMEMERVCADAEPCKLDGSGRIVLPPALRKEAGIRQDVLVIGARSHIEIWDRNRWSWERNRVRSGLDRLKAWPSRAS